MFTGKLYRDATTALPHSSRCYRNITQRTQEADDSDLTVPLQYEYTTPAINTVTLRITMGDGSQYTKETAVVTHGSEHYDAIFLSLWNGMNEALLGKLH